LVRVAAPSLVRALSDRAFGEPENLRDRHASMMAASKSKSMHASTPVAAGYARVSGQPSHFAAPDRAPRGAPPRHLQGCSITGSTYIPVHRKLLSGNIGRGRADWPLEGA